MDESGSARAPGIGRVTRPGKTTRKHQIIRTTPGKRWSAEAERIFLEELAATANVRGSAAAAGFSTPALYNRRMRWPAFAEAWQQALEQGYARIETALIEMASDTALIWSDAKLAEARARAKAAAAGTALPGDGDGAGAGGDGSAVLDRVDGGAPSRRPALSVSEMMNILKLHRATVRGGAAQDFGWRAGPPDMEAVRASIRRKIEAIVRMEERRKAAGLPLDVED